MLTEIYIFETITENQNKNIKTIFCWYLNYKSLHFRRNTMNTYFEYVIILRNIYNNVI